MALSCGLSRALCLLHRLRGTGGTAASLWGTAGEAGPGALTFTGVRPRILCLSCSPDCPAQYVAVMNAIFSAQRAEVAIDALMLGMDSPYLQQAAHLTAGLYVRAGPGSKDAGASVQRPAQAAAGRVAGQGSSAAGEQLGAALQYLLTIFSADTGTRSMLRVHQPLGVDFRASCFCHKKPIPIGHVCSVCLAIFCEPAPQCVICKWRVGQLG